MAVLHLVISRNVRAGGIRWRRVKTTATSNNNVVGKGEGMAVTGVMVCGRHILHHVIILITLWSFIHPGSAIQSENEINVIQPVAPNQRNRVYNQRNNFYSSSRNESSSVISVQPTKCYDFRGQALRCVPEFVNAAFTREVEVTDTCGLTGPSKYCFQAGDSSDSHKITPTQCDYCDASNDSLSHHSSYLTDVNDHNMQTWWQSRTMFEGVQNLKAKEPVKQVNLTLHLGQFTLSKRSFFLMFDCFCITAHRQSIRHHVHPAQVLLTPTSEFCDL